MFHHLPAVSGASHCPVLASVVPGDCQPICLWVLSGAQVGPGQRVCPGMSGCPRKGAAQCAGPAGVAIALGESPLGLRVSPS